MLKVNLLPQELRPRIVLNLDKTLLFLFLSVVSISALGLLTVTAKLKKAQNQVAVLQADADAQNKRIEELRSQETKIDASATPTQALIANRKTWNPFLKELTYIMPNDVWLTKLLVKSDSKDIDMQLWGLAPSQKAMNRFLGRMERAPSFQHVKMNAASLREDFTPALYTFDFSVPSMYGTKAARTIAGQDGK